jgi:hypothetical protein
MIEPLLLVSPVAEAVFTPAHLGRQGIEIQLSVFGRCSGDAWPNIVIAQDVQSAPIARAV